MDILSIIGTFLTASASLPQLFHTCRKTGPGISKYSIVARILAASVWGTWAALKQEWTLAISCSIVFIVEFAMITLTCLRNDQ